MGELTPDIRLITAARLFPACDLGADIGADHGRLSCYLLQTDKAARMIVSDISEPSLEKARALFARHGLSARADFIVADGLDALRAPVNAALICGMGGSTIAKILLKSPERLCGAALVLSPHNDETVLRAALESIEYTIEEEHIAPYRKALYVVMRAVPGAMRLSARERYLGPMLMKETGDAYLKYLEKRQRHISPGRGPEIEEKRGWIKEEIERVQQAERAKGL